MTETCATCAMLRKWNEDKTELIRRLEQQVENLKRSRNKLADDSAREAMREKKA